MTLEKMPRARREIKIEGYTVDELLALPAQEIGDYVLTGEPLILRIGSAEMLGEFRIVGERLVIELAEIRGGGEGVLPMLAAICGRYAKSLGLSELEWIVHAVHCAEPNLKLRRVLVRKGFRVCRLPEIGDVYHLVRKLDP